MKYNSKEFKVMWIREGEPHDEGFLCETPRDAFDYWNEVISKSDWFDAKKEAMVVVCLNPRSRVEGYNLVSLGTLDSTSLHPREIFRPAIVMSVSSIVLMHNHPSGDPQPSDADIRATRLLIQAGSILNIRVIDHIVVGRPMSKPKQKFKYSAAGFYSLKEMASAHALDFQIS